MSLEEIPKKIDVADKTLTKLELLLRKHWGKLLVIGLLGSVYWLFSLTQDQAIEYETKAHNARKVLHSVVSDSVMSQGGSSYKPTPKELGVK